MRPILLHTSPVKNYLIWQKTCRTASNAPWKATWVLMIFSVITSNDKVTDNWLYWIGRLNHNSTATTLLLTSFHTILWTMKEVHSVALAIVQVSVPLKIPYGQTKCNWKQTAWHAGKLHLWLRSLSVRKKMQLLDRTEVTLTFPSAILHSYPLKFTNLL